MFAQFARLDLAAMSRKCSFTILENDIYSSLRYRGEPATIRALASESPIVLLPSQFFEIAFLVCGLAGSVARDV